MNSDGKTPQQRLAEAICDALDLDADLVLDLQLDLKPSRRQVRAVLAVSDEQWTRLLALATQEGL